jgi:hypothetical protein
MVTKGTEIVQGSQPNTQKENQTIGKSWRDEASSSMQRKIKISMQRWRRFSQSEDSRGDAFFLHIKVVKITILTRHGKYKTNSDRKNGS